MEASTLGDLDSLQALKQQMEATEKGGKAAKKKAETAAAEVAAAEVTEPVIAEVAEAPKAEVEVEEKSTETTDGAEA